MNSKDDKKSPSSTNEDTLEFRPDDSECLYCTGIYVVSSLRYLLLTAIVRSFSF